MKRCTFRIPTVLGMLALASASAVADPLNTLYNTGVDDARNALPSQAVDPHYRLVSSADPTYPGPSAYTTDPIPSPPWIANTGASRWITPRTDDSGNVAPGEYVYRLLFDVPGLPTQTVSISGLLATDDGGGVRLNGVDKGVVSGGFGGYTSFTITGDFKPGTNVLEFYVVNGGAGANPSGLRVDGLTGSGAAPVVNLSTAYDEATGTTIAPGNPDDDWVLTSAPAGITLSAAKSIAKHPAWYGVDSAARWIAPQESAGGTSDLPVGDYTYQTGFHLDRTGKLFRLAGNIGSDNSTLAFTLNGTTVAGHTGGFGAPADLPNVTDQTLFVDGLNIVQAIVNNAGDSPNPHGFQLSAWIEQIGLSTAPVAEAGGGYLIDKMGWNDLNLDASGSFDVDVALGDTIVRYEWDLNNDGTYDFSTGNPLLSLTRALYEPFLNADGTYTIGLRTTDATGLTGSDTAQVTVVPEPATLALIGVTSLLGLKVRRRMA